MYHTSFAHDPRSSPVIAVQPCGPRCGQMQSGVLCRCGLACPYRELRAQMHAQYGSFSVQPTIRVSTPDAANLLDGIVSANLGQMRRRQQPPTGLGSMPILRGIQSGRVRYERADPDERWQTWDELVAQLAKKGGKGIAQGDCEDLSAAVAAEMIYAGEPARTYVYKSGHTLYHVVVWTKRWGILDPSRAAGMGGNG